MSDREALLSDPELVIGIAGPIGIDIDSISDEISRSLRMVGYGSETIRVTDMMTEFPVSDIQEPSNGYLAKMNYKIEYANALCSANTDPSFLMRIAMKGITENRADVLSRNPAAKKGIANRTAFIIRQLKRPQEVQLLRKVYGKQFVLVSGYGKFSDRKKRLVEKEKGSLPLSVNDADIERDALAILQRDQDEGRDKNLQHLRDTYHLADVFVDGIDLSRMRSGVDRFFQAFFGRNDIGPTRIEYGMYAAKAASLRSTDLSRQVGSAIFSPAGDIISQGCNEVPKAFGGTYWFGEEPDFRDVVIGYDPNDKLKKDVIRDFLERLSKAKLLKENDVEKVASDQFVEILLGRGAEEFSCENSQDDETEAQKLPEHFSCLKGSQVADLTEYGRVVHAEMAAICDAARCGKPIRDCILYVTTFPCHNCTKHIIASGINRVYFLEPYPKSRAKDLHENEIEIEAASQTKVSFIPFLGISPFRYRDIFEKGSRKSGAEAITWYEDDRPHPLVPKQLPNYINIEKIEIDEIEWDFNAQAALPFDAEETDTDDGDGKNGVSD